MFNKTHCIQLVGCLCVLVLILFIPKSSLAAINVIADYHFDECEYTGTGYEAIDSEGGNNARAVDAVTTESEGQIGRYADLQSYSQAFAPNTSIDLGSTWSVSAWFRMPIASSNRYHVLAVTTLGEELFYLDKNKDYKWAVYIPGKKDKYGNFRFNSLSNGWHHLALVGQRGKTYLYVDGDYEGSVDLQATGVLAYFGGSVNDRNTSTWYGFHKPLDEFMLFSGALSSREVTQIYNNQRVGKNFDGSNRETPQCGQQIPVAEYRLDECLWAGTTGEVVDSSGNNLHGTAVLSPASVDVSSEDGGVCQAASMGGVSHLAVPDNDLLDIPDNLTAMAWVRPDSIPQSGIKSILSKDTNYEFHIDSNGQIYWWWRSSGTSYTLTTTNANITPGEWSHVVVRFSAGTATIFINGTPSISRSTYPVTLDTNSDPLQLGGDYIGTRYFSGILDEVMVFKVALDDTAIQDIYVAQQNKNNYDNSTRICSACEGLTDTITISTTGSGGRLGSPAVTFDDSDLVEYTIPDKAAELVVHVGDLFAKGTNEVNAAHIDTDGTIYFSVGKSSRTINGLNVKTGDILKYDPVSGIVTIYLDGGSHFSNNGETVDAIYLLDNGNFILSTAGSASLGGVNFEDEDLVEYNPNDRAANIYFDGSSHFTSDEDINGIHIIDSSRMLLSTESDAQLGALSFKKGDVILYAPTPRVASVFMNGATEFGSEQNIDTITVAYPSLMVDHYEIVHDGSAMTCTPEEIQVLACLTIDCSLLSTTSATLSLIPSGWVDGDEFTFTGNIDVSLRHTTPETVTLGITNPIPVAANDYKCVESIGGSGVSCNMEFYDSGFSFSVPTQVSGKSSADITINAVKKSDTGTRCVPAFSNRSETINFWTAYLSPASGSMNLTVNGSSVSTSSPGTGVSLSFDVSGQAVFTVKYLDAGQLELNTRYEGAGDEAGLVMSGNSSFVTHPAGLCVYSDAADSDCASGDGNCSSFVAAGTPFGLKVKGVAWENDTEVDTDFCDSNTETPNYQHTGIGVSHTLVAPGSGLPGAIDITVANITSSGEVEIDQVVSEVGVFSFTADPPADYLGAGDVFGGRVYTSANIGRFIPEHFEVSILPDPPAFEETCLIFTYLGESFDYQTVPDLTITAMNGAAMPTQTENYEGGFFKLDTTLQYSYVDNNVPAGASPLTPTSSSQEIDDTVDCGGTVSVALLEDDAIAGNGIKDGFNYTRPLPDNPAAPFVSDVTMTLPAVQITDSDGVCFDAGSGCQKFQLAGIAGVHVWHGRSLAEPVFGPETETLVMPVNSYWYDGTNWLENTDDDCSVFTYTLIESGMSVTASPAGPFILSGGSGDLTLTPDAGSNRGTVSISFDFPAWLEPDPGAIATFGISRGNDRILNWQEIMR